MTDRRGSDPVTVTVGAAGENGGLSFRPVAVRVSPGTTVVWEWTGEGGAHNVVSQDGTLDSGDPVDEADVTYEATLDDAETYLYYCEPHRTVGMRGAVVVRE